MFIFVFLCPFRWQRLHIFIGRTSSNIFYYSHNKFFIALVNINGGKLYDFNVNLST